jgi:hypothetical protein
MSEDRGGYGKSWFKVDLTSEYVPYDDFNLYLDTTPPQNPTFIINNGGATTEEQIVTAHLGHSDRTRTGYEIKIWGDVDTAYDAAVARTEAQSDWVAFSPTYLFKLSDFNGSKRLYAKIRDDVWNETETLTVTIAFTGGEDPVIEIGKAADAPNFTSTPIVGEEFEQTWAAEINVTIPVETLTRVSGSVSARKYVSTSASGQVSASRTVEFITEGTRLEATRWNRIIRDEEELLLNL